MLLYARHAITRVLWKRSRLKLNTKIQTKVNRGIRIREKHWGNIKLPLLAISLTNTSASPVLGCPIQLTGEVKSPEGKGTRRRRNHSILHIQADFCWIIQIRPVEVSQYRWTSSSIIQSQEMLRLQVSQQTTRRDDRSKRREENYKKKSNKNRQHGRPTPTWSPVAVGS